MKHKIQCLLQWIYSCTEWHLKKKKQKKTSKEFFFSEFKVAVGIAKSLWQFIHDSDKNVYWTGLMECVRILLVST